MIFWVIALVLVLLAAAIGFFLGGIRAAIGLLGTIVAAYLAQTVGALVAGVVPSIGFRHPIWQFYVPPILGFLLVSLVFLIIGLVVHHLVQRHYRNNTDEYTVARWTRLNQRTGVAVGSVVGLVWLILVSIVAYFPGYITTQLADDNEAGTALRTANSLTHGLEETGMIKVVEHYRPAAERHFVAADILGLVYNNPSIHSRLASYPPFLGLAEKPEIGELGRDPEVNTLIQSKAGLNEVLQHARIQAVTENHDLVNELLALDLADLHEYLLTGVSPKYKDETILGRWRLNVRRSIAEMKTVSTEKLPPVEFNLLRKALNVFLQDMTVGFTTDNRTLLKVKAKDEQKLLQTVGRAGPPAAAASAQGGEGGAESGVGTGTGLTPRSIVSRVIPQAPPSDGMTPELRQRYGLGGGGGGRGGAGGGAGPQPLASGAAPATVRVQPPKAPTTSTLAPMMSSGEGSWARDGENYRITVKNGDREVTLQARVVEHQLIATADGRTLVFDRL